MTAKKRRRKLPLLASRVSEDRDLMKAVLREVLKGVLKGEMTEPLGAAPRQRAESRQGYRAGDDSRGLVTRIGKRKLRVPRGPQR